MTLATDEAQGRCGTLDVSLFYLAPLEVYQTVKPYYVNWPVHHIPGAVQSNLSHEKYPVRIQDIRGWENDFKIDGCGFELLNHDTSMASDDFGDDAKIRLTYYPEMTELVTTKLNASSAFVFEHTHRKQVPEVGCGADRKRKPLVSAHIDQTPAAAVKRVMHHMGDKAEELLKKRFQVINIWRPLFGPIRDYPLTLGDIRTFDLQRDSVPTDLVFPHYVGESLNLLHGPDHKWYYLSDQQKDEVWMFKCFDSKADGVSSAAPHCSFDIQKGDQKFRARESIEVRMLVFYDE